MFEAFLANTSVEGLRPLGTAPQRSFELVTGTVRDACGARHAALFAEPVAAQHGNSFDWYATAAGTPAPLADLSEDEATAARDILDGLVADIRRHADTLLRSKDPDDQRLGEALANALEIPGEDAIFVLRTENTDDGAALQPVLVNWAWVRDEQKSVRGVLTGVDKRPAPGHAATPRPPAPPHPGATAAVTPGRGTMLWWWLVWLGWALLALLIAMVIYLLIEPCALRAAIFPDDCPRDTVQPATPEDERRLLQDNIARLERQIAMADRACQPDIAALPIPDLPDPTRPVEDTDKAALHDEQINDRAERSGATRGDLTFTVIWDGPDDLDLHVTCPAGDTLSFLNDNVCNGRLDVDSNAQEIAVDPIENAYFSDPPPGSYGVRVHLYRDRDGAAQRSFTLQIRDGGQVITRQGSVSDATPSWQHEHQYEGR
ncbi:hypothetical protein [Roseovarius sp. SYSU LYC5161]|uniref:hypothetical protein n=1 Tax=Roseovarius halophilus (ex Wu et al. 2025) TaxID=3376060 RepID=UPI003999926D